MRRQRETVDRVNIEAECLANGERSNTQETQLNEDGMKAPSANQRGGTKKDEKPLTREYVDRIHPES